MRFHSILVLSLVCLAIPCAAQAQLIEIRPKQPPTESPKAPQKPLAPRIPMPKSSSPEGLPLKTIIEIDIVALELLGDPSAQNWSKVLGDLGASVRIRNGRDAKPGVTEKVRGSLRFVTASGLLNREGEISFGSVSFRLDESERLQEWLDELKTYGAQGTPEGKPLWGLSRLQFELVNEQMSRPLTVVAQGQSLTTLVQSLQHDATLSVRLNTATVEWLKDSAHDRPITVDVSGFTTGTGLAIALNEVGTGMRPVRTPEGEIVYEILPLDQLSDPWPIGWEPKEETPRDQITPGFFKMGVVEFDKSPLVEVLAAIQTESKTPIVIDTRKCLARKIDVNKVTASYPRKRTAWALVVSHCVRQAGLYNHYRQDEAGRGFILIAPFEPKVLEAE